MEFVLTLVNAAVQVAGVVLAAYIVYRTLVVADTEATEYAPPAEIAAVHGAGVELVPPIVCMSGQLLLLRLR